MDKAQTRLVNAAFSFMSNEDEFGVFLQGYCVAAIHAHGQAIKDSLNLFKMPVLSGASVATLFEAFLSSKRSSEALLLDCPPAAIAVRRQLMAYLYKELAGDGKEKGE